MSKLISSLSLFYHLFRKHILKRDVQMLISPITLRHIERYRLASTLLLKQGRLLDAACGSGYGSAYLTDHEYVGLDLDSGVIRYAKSNYAGSFYNMSVEQASELGSFDHIVSFETLEHVDDPDQTLGVLIKILKPGGCMVMSFPLNHPDTIYHQHVFNRDSVRLILEKHFRPDLFSMQFLLQKHTTFSEVDLSAMDNESDGTLIVIARGSTGAVA